MPENKCQEPCADLTRLEQQMKDLQRQNGEDHKELRDRLSKVELTNAIQNERYDAILVKLDDLSGKHDRLVKKLEELEAKPARRWDKLVETALVCAATAIIAFLLGRVGL